MLFLGYQVYIGWDQVQPEHWQLALWNLVPAAVALLVAFLLNATMWNLVIRSHGVRLTFKKNLEIFALTSMARRLPGAVWQLAGRIALYRQDGISGLAPLQGSIWEILVQALTALAVFQVFLPWYRSLVPPFAGYLWIILVVFLPLSLRPSLLSQALRWIQRQFGLRWRVESQVQSRDVWVWFLLYFASWINGGLILYFLLRALYADVGVSWLPALCGFVALSGMIGICVSAIPGGLGLREVSLSMLLGHYMPASVAVGAAVVFRLWVLGGETLYALLALSVIHLDQSRRDEPTL